MSKGKNNTPSLTRKEKEKLENSVIIMPDELKADYRVETVHQDMLNPGNLVVLDVDQLSQDHPPYGEAVGIVTKVRRGKGKTIGHVEVLIGTKFTRQKGPYFDRFRTDTRKLTAKT